MKLEKFIDSIDLSLRLPAWGLST